MVWPVLTRKVLQGGQKTFLRVNSCTVAAGTPVCSDPEFRLGREVQPDSAWQTHMRNHLLESGLLP